MIFDRPNAFSEDKCEALIAFAKAGGLRPAPVYGSGEPSLQPLLRSASHLLIHREPRVAWLFDRLDGLFLEASALFATPIHPLAEPVQLVRYGAGDHFQMWHSDAGLDRLDGRRLSASVELSSPEDYRGGMLEVVPDRIMPGRSPPRGHATLFPSRALHRVTCVTEGVRFALVAWAGLNAA